jgi:hypothetical protein
MNEAMDMDGRLDQLVRAGLMPTSSLPLLKRAISRMHAGMSLQGAERDVMNMFISSMMFIVLGDDTVFNKARAGAKTYATEAKEKQEYDYEGDMAMSQLKSIIANSQRMHDMLSDDTNLPEWVQSKITLAEDYISTASNYMQGEMNEEKMPFKGPYRKVGERKDKYGNPVKNVAKHLAKKAMNAQKNEEVESIEELSTATLKSYRTKARADAYDADDVDDNRRFRKRAAGSNTAGKKLVKRDENLRAEEVEELDELSKKTVAAYLDKSEPRLKDYAHPQVIKRRKSAQTAKSKLGLPTGSNRGGYGRATTYHTPRVAATEEVEQVVEISKAMAGRYINKAKDSIDMTSYRSGIKDGTAISSSTPYKSNNPLEKKLTKRHKGISMAVKKLTKEEIEGLEEYAVSKTPPTARTLKPEVKPTMNPAFKPKTRQSSVGTLARVRSGMAKRLNNGNVKEDIDAVKQMNESYKTAFETALNEYGIKSPSELDESKRKEFFNHVDLEFKKGDN